MVEKPFQVDDPMELVAVALPQGHMAEMAECLVEEYIRDGWDDESLLRLFRDPFYRATHNIYQVQGEAYVLALLARLRQKWGQWRGDDISARLLSDEAKKQLIAEVEGDA